MDPFFDREKSLSATKAASIFGFILGLMFSILLLLMLATRYLLTSYIDELSILIGIEISLINIQTVGMFALGGMFAWFTGNSFLAFFKLFERKDKDREQ